MRCQEGSRLLRRLSREVYEHGTQGLERVILHASAVIFLLPFSIPMHLDSSLVAVQMIADQCVTLAFFNLSEYVMLPFICGFFDDVARMEGEPSG